MAIPKNDRVSFQSSPQGTEFRVDTFSLDSSFESPNAVSPQCLDMTPEIQSRAEHMTDTSTEREEMEYSDAECAVRMPAELQTKSQSVPPILSINKPRSR